jgi:SanA protein
MIRRRGPRRGYFRTIIWIVTLAIAIPALGAALIEVCVFAAARGAVYRDVEAIPPRRVAIIFGAQVLPGGQLSVALANRVDAGIALYQAGKVQRLLMTGDRREENYDEPDVMRVYALAHGVPDGAILLDYSGLRTYDSCYRARSVFAFRADEAVVVTQEYHLPRALFTCDGLGLRAIGYVAVPFYGPREREAELREHPARWLAWWQVTITRPTPAVVR